MNGESLDIKQIQLEKLKTCLAAVKQLFPEAITEGKIDWEKLQATLGKESAIGGLNERYVLNWAGKTDAFKVLQQTTTATLKPVPEESINFDITENVFIEGENLEVLKVLQKAYYGKIKVIEIDPPYNTGNDSFIYPDSFKESKEDYQKRIGEKDEEGYLLKEGFFRKNSKDSGHYHSNWLSMMYPRLFLAKNLLRDDGVIFVHIDDNEVHNLRLIMNEIFGEENFRNAIIIKRGVKSVQMQFETVDKLGSGYETILMYTKNANYRFPRIEKRLDEIKSGSWNNHWRGTDRPTMRYELFGIIPESGQWRWSKERSLKAIENYKVMLQDLSKNENEITQEEIDKWYLDKINEIGEEIDLLRLSKNSKPEHYISPSETTLANDVWFDLPPNSTGALKALFGAKVFDNPKPIQLIKRFLYFFTDVNSIILDFFSGSATTAQAVLEQNKEDGGKRKFILVQLPEKCDEGSEAYKAGYKTIADIGKERIRRVIKRLNHDSSDSKITMIQDKEQQKLFAEEKNQGNQINHINQSSDNGFKVFKLAPSNFKIWRGDEITEENLETQLDAFTNPVREGSEKENILYELMLKAGYLLTDKVQEVKVLSTRGDLGVCYHSVNDGELIIALEEMNQQLIDTIISAKPKKVITLDKLFTGNDQLKTNTVLQMRDAEIDFKTI